jgi:hypothetical protein
LNADRNKKAYKKIEKEQKKPGGKDEQENIQVAVRVSDFINQANKRKDNT